LRDALSPEYTVTRSSADIAIVGGGVAGLSAALALADTGLDVVLLADVRAGEASPAAAPG
jgi:glycine/D-amino acid oxidase-like deaminating enzyme